MGITLEVEPTAIVRPLRRARTPFSVLATKSLAITLAPAAVYVAVRLTSLLLLAVFADFHNDKFYDLLRAWDGNWYLIIAENGYANVPDNFIDAFGKHTPYTAMAFFPGFPFITRGVGLATDADLFTAGLIVNAAAGIAAAYAIAKIGRLVTGRPRAGLLLVALWAGAPMAITLSMTYTEAIFTAASAWALAAVLERQWVEAGCYCMVAGVVRPTATVIVGVVGLAALIALFGSLRRKEGGHWPILVGGLIAPLGLAGYWGFVALQTGKVGGWWQIQQEGWHSQFDWGVTSFEFARKVLVESNVVMDLFIVLILLAAVVLVVVSVLSRMPNRLRRIPWPLIAYGAGIVAVTIGSDGMMASKPRMLVPAFALLVPVAMALANRSRPTMIAATLGFVLFGGWFSAYGLTTWHYAI